MAKHNDKIHKMQLLHNLEVCVKKKHRKPYNIYFTFVLIVIPHVLIFTHKVPKYTFYTFSKTNSYNSVLSRMRMAKHGVAKILT